MSDRSCSLPFLPSKRRWVSDPRWLYRQDRCGVDHPDEALRLAEAILEAPGVSFGGLQAYHGGIQHVRSYEDRGRAVQAVADRAEVRPQWKRFSRRRPHVLDEEAVTCHAGLVPNSASAGEGETGRSGLPLLALDFPPKPRPDTRHEQLNDPA